MRNKLIALVSGFLGRCGLDESEAEDIVEYAEWKHRVHITCAVNRDVVETIVQEVRKEVHDCYHGKIDDRIVANFKRLAIREN